MKQLLLILALLPVTLLAQTGVDKYGNACYCDTPSSYEYGYRQIKKRTSTCTDPVFNTRLATLDIKQYYVRVAVISKSNTAGYYKGLEREPVPLVLGLNPNKYDQVRTVKTRNLDEALWLKKEMERIGYCKPTLVSETIKVQRYY